MVKCPNCGTLNLNTNNFCGECGTKLPKSADYCIDCDITFLNGEKYCTNCGKKLIIKPNPIIKKNTHPNNNSSNADVKLVKKPIVTYDYSNADYRSF